MRVRSLCSQDLGDRSWISNSGITALNADVSSHVIQPVLDGIHEQLRQSWTALDGMQAQMQAQLDRSSEWMHRQDARAPEIDKPLVTLGARILSLGTDPRGT